MRQTMQSTHLRRDGRVQGTMNDRDLIGVLSSGHGVRREGGYHSFGRYPWVEESPGVGPRTYIECPGE